MFLSNTLKGQGYIPLLDTAKQWYIIQTSYAYGGAPSYRTTGELEILSGDTIINSILYKKIIINHYEMPVFLPTGLVGFVREDTLEKKVYFKPSFQFSQDTVERLLYDFSAEIGDSIEIFGLFSKPEGYIENIYIIESLDSITLLNNEKRKVWNLIQHPESGLGWTDQWIEGIGSKQGLIFPCYYEVSTNGETYDLLCFYDDATNLYIHPLYDTCHVEWTSNILELTKPKAIIYPNPADDKLILSMSDIYESRGSIQIIDIYGKIVFKDEFSEKNHEILLSNLSSGLYIIRIEIAQQIMMIKFFKQ